MDSAYVTAWLADDTAGVMATLAPDAVLMPAGQRPLTDDASIRAFWWPQDGSRTRVTALRSVPEEIEGSPSRAFVRGTAEMEFEYFAADSSQVKLSNRVMTLTILAPDATGHWRIKRRMWGPLASATR